MEWTDHTNHIWWIEPQGPISERFCFDYIRAGSGIWVPGHYSGRFFR